MAKISITTDQLSAYIQAATMLVTFGGVAVKTIRSMFGQLQGLTDVQLNAIIDAIESDARRRKALADAESGSDSVEPTD